MGYFLNRVSIKCNEDSERLNQILPFLCWFSIAELEMPLNSFSGLPLIVREELVSVTKKDGEKIKANKMKT